MRRPVRALALSGAVLAIVSVVATAMVGNDRILEEWYLYRLRSGRAEQKDTVIGALLEMKSVRALVPIMAEVEVGFRRNPPLAALPEIYLDELGGDDSAVVVDVGVDRTTKQARYFAWGDGAGHVDGLRETCATRGIDAVPYLVAGLQHQSVDVRCWSAYFLREVGSEAATTSVPALKSALVDKNSLVRELAADTLNLILEDGFKLSAGTGGRSW